MIEKSEIIRLIEEKLENTANYLVDVIIKSDNIIVEIDNDKGVCINDCENLSRYLEERLDLSAKNFELEVGSAGITSPFKILRKKKKNVGNEVEVLLKEGKKLTGVLKEATEEGILLTVEKKIKPEGGKRKITVQEDIPYTFDNIKSTKYLIRFK